VKTKPVILLAALAVGVVALVVGIMPVAYGVPVWIGLAASTALVVGLPFVLGRRIGEEPRNRQQLSEVGKNAEPT